MDFSNDPNPVALFRYLESGLAEQWVLEGLDKGFDKSASEGSEIFADPENGEYPLGGPAQVVAGRIHHHFLLPDQRQPHHEVIGSNLQKAAAYWDVAEHVDEVISKLELTRQKQASSREPKYAYVHEGTGYWPLNDYLEVLSSASAVCERIRSRDLPEKVLHKAAAAIVDAAPELGVERSQLPYPILALGTPKALSFSKAASRIESRHGFVPEEAMTTYRDVVKSASTEPEELENYIELLEELDAHYKVAYSITQPSPRELFFGSDLQELKDAINQHVLTHEGVPIPMPLFKVAVARLETDLPTLFLQAQADNIVKIAAMNEGLEMTQAFNEYLTPATQDKLVKHIIRTLQS